MTQQKRWVLIAEKFLCLAAILAISFSATLCMTWVMIRALQYLGAL